MTPEPPSNCECARPLPQERATQKGASQTVCGRCGLPILLRLGVGAGGG